jgi:hypothetical protein
MKRCGAQGAEGDINEMLAEFLIHYEGNIGA